MSRSWSYAKPIFTLQFEDTTRIPRFQDIKSYLFLHTSDFLLLWATILIGMLWTKKLYSRLVVSILSKLISEQSGREAGDTPEDTFKNF